MSNIIASYLYGVVAALVVTAIIIATKKKVRVSDLMESLVNCLSSWVFFLSIFVKFITTILNFKEWNAVLWSRKGADAEEKKQRIIRTKK